MRIYINQQDINKAINESGFTNVCRTCPIAQALRRKFGKEYIVGDMTGIRLNNKQIFEHTNSSYDFIKRFDDSLNRKTVKPQHVYLRKVNNENICESTGY